MNTRKCLNTACLYHMAGKCTLFRGDAWLNCRHSAAPKKKTTRKPKGK